MKLTARSNLFVTLAGIVSPAHAGLLRPMSRTHRALVQGSVVVVVVVVEDVVVMEEAALVVVTGAVAPSSYAPISHVAMPSPLPSSGRGKPRWSVAGGGQSFPPASIAGLPGKSAWVGVGPPLSCSGPSCGSMLTRSPGDAKPQALPLSRLCP